MTKLPFTSAEDYIPARLFKASNNTDKSKTTEIFEVLPIGTILTAIKS